MGPNFGGVLSGGTWLTGLYAGGRSHESRACYPGRKVERALPQGRPRRPHPRWRGAFRARDDPGGPRRVRLRPRPPAADAEFWSTDERAAIAGIVQVSFDEFHARYATTARRGELVEMLREDLVALRDGCEASQSLVFGPFLGTGPQPDAVHLVFARRLSSAASRRLLLTGGAPPLAHPQQIRVSIYDTMDVEHCLDRFNGHRNRLQDGLRLFLEYLLELVP